MKKDNALLVAGFVFSLVALAHLLRLILGSEIMVSGYTIPQNVSVIALIVALLLAVWMFKARGKK